jgi:hypothetical protein
MEDGRIIKLWIMNMNELLKKLATDYTDNTDYLIISLLEC